MFGFGNIVFYFYYYDNENTYGKLLDTLEFGWILVFYK